MDAIVYKSDIYTRSSTRRRSPGSRALHPPSLKASTGELDVGENRLELI